MSALRDAARYRKFRAKVRDMPSIVRWTAPEALDKWVDSLP